MDSHKLARRPPPTPLTGLTTNPNSACPSPATATALLPSDLTTPVPPTPTGLRAQLQHLLPRHAIFHVRLQIHDISSVPLIAGEFAVRWRFKNVHVVPGARAGGFLGLGGKKHHHNAHRQRSRSRPRNGPTNDNLAKDIGTTSEESPASGHGSPDSMSLDGHPPIPSLVISVNTPTSSPDSLSPSATTPAPTPLPSPSFPIPTAHSVPRIPTLAELTSLRISGLPTQPQHKAASTPSLAATTPIDGYSTPRGLTPYIPLRDHKVLWEHTVDIAVKMDVERDTHRLMASELKLEVMQRVLPNDPNAPHQPRLGVIRLNLAEYATPEAVTQHYLLQKSKTNATLRLTVALEQIGGDRSFIAPPLSRSGVLAGVRGVLDSEVLRMRPRLEGLDREARGIQRGLDSATLGSPGFPPVPSFPALGGLGLYSEFGGLGAPRSPDGSRSKSSLTIDVPSRSRSRQSQKATESQATMKLAPPLASRTPSSSSTYTTREGSRAGWGWSKHGKIRDETVSLDALMGLAYGPQATENLIEAIFNPVATSDPSKEGPFTYLVDSSPKRPPVIPQLSSRDVQPDHSVGEDSPSRSIGSSGSGVSPVILPSGETSRASSVRSRPHGQGDAASFYSTESSSASESLHSHQTHQSLASSHQSHQSQKSARSSLGIGLGQARPTPAADAVPPPEPPSPAEPSGRIKGWWKRIGGHPAPSIDPIVVSKPLPATPEPRTDPVAG
ncbi:hypothetical protein HGRIS_012181 [Hohenbuehelia grisea]|uniref:C2 NT-type domain-containing protein n=1 Tax=Hohenbuehelia grisea TaxID=104357 RepID=A0ABR3IRJ8_9AGAR